MGRNEFIVYDWNQVRFEPKSEGESQVIRACKSHTEKWFASSSANRISMSAQTLVQTCIFITAKRKHIACDIGVLFEEAQKRSLSLLMAGIAGRKMKRKTDRYSFHSINALPLWILVNSIQHHLTRKHSFPPTVSAFANAAAVSRSVISADVFSDWFHV